MTGGIRIPISADLSGVKKEVDDLGKDLKDALGQGLDSKGLDKLVDGLGDAAKNAKKLEDSLGAAGGKAGAGMGKAAADAKKLNDELAKAQRLQAALAKNGYNMSAAQAGEFGKDYSFWRDNNASPAMRKKLQGVSMESLLGGGWRSLGNNEVAARRQFNDMMRQLGLHAPGGAPAPAQQNFGRFMADMMRRAGGGVGGAIMAGSGVGGSIAQGALGSASGAAGGLLSLGGISRLAGGLGVAGLAYAAVRGIQATRAKIGTAEEEGVGYSDMLRQMGATSSTFDQLREAVRGASKNLDLSFGDGSKLAATYLHTSGADGLSSRQFTSELRGAGGFARMLGLDPEAGAGFFGVMRNTKVSSGDADNRRIAMMLGEAIARAGVFSKADEVLSAVSTYTKIATSAALSPANTGGYVGAMGNLLNMRQAGLDPAGAAGMLSTIDASFRHTGGEAQRNFLLGALQRAMPGMTSVDMGFMQDAGMFGTAAQVFGKGSAAYEAADGATQERYRKLAAQGGSRTFFDLAMGQMGGMSGDMQRKNMMGLFGLSDSQAAMLQQVTSLHGGSLSDTMMGVARKYDIDPSKLNGTSLRNVLDIEYGDPSQLRSKAAWFKAQGMSDGDRQMLDGALAKPGENNEDLKTVLMRLAPQYGMEMTDGDVSRKNMASLENLATDVATKLIPMTNSIREAVAAVANALTGGKFKDAYGATEKARAVLTNQLQGAGTPLDRRAAIGAMLAKVRANPDDYTKEFHASLEEQYADISSKAPDTAGNGGSLASGLSKASSRQIAQQAQQLSAASPYDDIFRRAGKKTGVDWRLLKLIGVKESGLFNRALHKNPNGTLDRGIMQLNSRYDGARGINDDNVEDPETNIMAGAEVFADAMRRSGGSLRGAFRNYNGSGKSAEQYADNSMALYDAAFGSIPAAAGSSNVRAGGGTQSHVVDVIVRSEKTGEPLAAPARVHIGGGPVPAGARQ